MGGEFAIDTLALDRDIRAMETKLRSANRDLEAMFESLQILNRMWEGPANEEFSRQFRADWESFQNVIQAAQTLAANMEEARQRYTGCGNTVDGIVASIRL